MGKAPGLARPTVAGESVPKQDTGQFAKDPGCTSGTSDQVKPKVGRIRYPPGPLVLIGLVTKDELLISQHWIFSERRIFLLPPAAPHSPLPR